jgi:hypothetical protein
MEILDLGPLLPNPKRIGGNMVMAQDALKPKNL